MERGDNKKDPRYVMDKMNSQEETEEMRKIGEQLHIYMINSP